MTENKFLLTGKEFEALLIEHRGIIWRICRMYHREEADQQDLYQEIVLRIWEALPGFRGESSLSTWIYRVALNMAISGFRKQKKQPQYGKINTDTLRVAETAGDEKQELINLMYKAINGLSDIEKAIVLLHLDQRPNEEIAMIMGITQNNLRVKMSRIRDRLRITMNVHRDG